jgi:hypothetical protein
VDKAIKSRPKRQSPDKFASMAALLSDILQFGLRLLDHWVAFATGSVPVMIVGAWEHWKGRSVSWRFYVVVFLAFGFTAASFQTWRQDRSERTHFRDAALVQQLQNYYVEAENQRRSVLEAQRASDQEFQVVKKKAETWAEDVGHWIIETMGWPAYVRLIKVPEEKLGGRDERAQLLFMITLIRDNLERLIENNAWDKQSRSGQPGQNFTRGQPWPSLRA